MEAMPASRSAVLGLVTGGHHRVSALEEGGGVCGSHLNDNGAPSRAQLDGHDRVAFIVEVWSRAHVTVSSERGQSPTEPVPVPGHCDFDSAASDAGMSTASVLWVMGGAMTVSGRPRRGQMTGPPAKVEVA